MSFFLFYPEIFFSIAILIQLLFNSILVNNVFYNFPILIREIFFQTFFILVCLLILLLNFKIEGFFFNFIFFTDQSTYYIKLFFVLCSCICLVFIFQGSIIQKLNFFEFYTIFLFCILSSLLLINTYDLLTFYLLLEMQALGFYVLASFKRNSAFSTEAGLKYFIFGSIISCFFLLGLSILYGITGSLNLHYLNLLFLFESSTYYDYSLLIGIYFVVCTFLFKLAVAPFHFWVPDVYEGSPLSSTIIFAILSKILFIYLFAKWIFVLGNLFFYLEGILQFVGILSVIIGAFLSLKQKRLKRFIIYSSISQIGFLILALTNNNFDSISYTYFFLFIYIITSILIWGLLVNFYISRTQISSFFNIKETSLFLSDFSNSFKINPIFAFSFVLIFFSIAGIPPLSGFLSKFLIILELVYSKFFIVSIVLVLITSISIFYYIRIIKILIFEPVKNEFLNLRLNLVISNNSFFNTSFFIYSFLLCLLILIFFFPSLFILACHFLTLNSFNF